MLLLVWMFRVNVSFLLVDLWKGNSAANKSSVCYLHLFLVFHRHLMLVEPRIIKEGWDRLASVHFKHFRSAACVNASTVNLLLKEGATKVRGRDLLYMYAWFYYHSMSLAQDQRYSTSQQSHCWSMLYKGKVWPKIIWFMVCQSLLLFCPAGSMWIDQQRICWVFWWLKRTHSLDMLCDFMHHYWLLLMSCQY